MPAEPRDTLKTARVSGTLKLAVLLVLLANAVLWVWLQGWARHWGFAPATSNEPWRVQQQIHPEALTLLSTEALARVQLQVASRSLPCWQTGPLDEASHTALEQALQNLHPVPLWQSAEVDEPERWMLFLGPYASPAVLDRKRTELLALKLHPRDVSHPQWGQGLSLGTFDSNAQAQQSLGELGQRGVRTARVLRDHGARAGRMVSVWTGDAAMRAQLDQLLAPTSQALSWQSCPKP